MVSEVVPDSGTRLGLTHNVDKAFLIWWSSLVLRLLFVNPTKWYSVAVLIRRSLSESTAAFAVRKAAYSRYIRQKIPSSIMFRNETRHGPIIDENESVRKM